jgi:hypothetical protein
MKTMLATLSLLIVAALSGAVSAGHPFGHHLGGHHGAGCQQPCCQQPGHICVPKVEKKPIKKTVYEVKCVPVCEHVPAKHLHGDCCPTCHLYYKKVLVKKEIECGEKCEVVCEPVPACQPAAPCVDAAVPAAAPTHDAQPSPAPEPAPLNPGR